MSRARIQYQPALDGLRALSVAAVLLFHGSIAGFSGGYLGVSVFFTLSGYLITSLLIAEHGAGGKVDTRAFYSRRAKRLLPASLLCLALIIAAAAITDWFDGVNDFRQEVIGAALQAANWVALLGEGSYQDLFSDTAGQLSPLEHYWSLAIEEQFYWLWPIAFVGLCRFAPTHRLRTIVVTSAAVVFGVLAPVIAVVWGPDAAYWATPARASEILVGAAVAFWLAERGEQCGQSGRLWWLGVAAVATLATAVATFPSSGGAAYNGALPLVGLGSALLIVGLQGGGPLVAALSRRPLVWLGQISYGVYLFHWPVFVVLDTRRTGFETNGYEGLGLFALRLAVTLIIAQMSFVLVERPIRTAVTLRPRFVGLSALATTAVVVAAAVVVLPASVGEYWNTPAVDTEAAQIVPIDPADLTPLVAETTTTATTTATATAAAASSPETAASSVSTQSELATSTSSTTSTLAPLPSLARPMRVLVAGDSTAEATGAGLAVWALEQPELAQVTVAAEKGCGFVRGGQRLVQEWEAVPDRCERWLSNDLISDVANLQPDVVMLLTTSWDVLDHRWAGERGLTPLDTEFADRIANDFDVLTSNLLDAGAGHVVWVLEPIPNVFWWGSGQSQEDPARHQVLYETMTALAKARPLHVTVVDLPTWLDEHDLSLDQQARPDGVHWTPQTATLIASEFLGEELIRAALRTSTG